MGTTRMPWRSTILAVTSPPVSVTIMYLLIAIPSTNFHPRIARRKNGAPDNLTRRLAMRAILYNITQYVV